MHVRGATELKGVSGSFERTNWSVVKFKLVLNISLFHQSLSHDCQGPQHSGRCLQLQGNLLAVALPWVPTRTNISMVTFCFSNYQMENRSHQMIICWTWLKVSVLLKKQTKKQQHSHWGLKSVVCETRIQAMVPEIHAQNMKHLWKPPLEHLEPLSFIYSWYIHKKSFSHAIRKFQRFITVTTHCIHTRVNKDLELSLCQHSSRQKHDSDCPLSHFYSSS